MPDFIPVTLALLDLSTATITGLLNTWGYSIVAFAVAIESSGIPFPGETVLVAAAVYAGTGHLSITWVICAAAAGAIMGDNAGYLAGRQAGRRLILRYGRYIRVQAHHLEQAERFFEKHGDKTVFIGRHFAILRAWAALLAGINRMRWQTFLIYNAAGGIVWAIMYGMLGYVLGSNLPLLHRILSVLSIGGAILVALLAVALFIVWRRRRARDTRPGERAA